MAEYYHLMNWGLMVYNIIQKRQQSKKNKNNNK